VAAATPGALLSARDAVAIDTPAMRAISAMLIFSDGRDTS
jgi:hypothetical protein